MYWVKCVGFIIFLGIDCFYGCLWFSIFFDCVNICFCWYRRFVGFLNHIFPWFTSFVNCVNISFSGVSDAPYLLFLCFFEVKDGYRTTNIWYVSISWPSILFLKRFINKSGSHVQFFSSNQPWSILNQPFALADCPWK